MPRLHEAVAVGNIDQVREYIDAGDNVNAMTKSVTSTGKIYFPENVVQGKLWRFMTPLHLAAYNGHTQIAKILIKAGAEINRPDVWNYTSGNTAFEMAIENKHFGLAKMLKEFGAQDTNNLLEKALSNRDIPHELLLAVLDKKLEVVEEIYTSGLLTKQIGEQALINAAGYNAVTVAEVLLECGVSPDAYNQENTALGTAAAHGHDAMAELLLQRGAEVDKYTATTQWQSDCTPLREALIHTDDRPSNPHLIDLLLAYGADIRKINDNGLGCLAGLGKPEELELLLQHGLNPNTITGGQRLLNICLEHQKFDLAIKFINYGADVTFIDNNGKSYLHKSNNLELTQLLLTKGLPIECYDKEGKTPIECVD